MILERNPRFGVKVGCQHCWVKEIITIYIHVHQIDILILLDYCILIILILTSSHQKKTVKKNNLLCWTTSSHPISVNALFILFSSEEMLERHMLSHRDFERVNGQYHCRDCTRVYATRNGYLKHKRQGTCFKRDNIFEDGTVGDFQCEICNICFRTENFLRLHKDKVGAFTRTHRLSFKFGFLFDNLNQSQVAFMYW